MVGGSLVQLSSSARGDLRPPVVSPSPESQNVGCNAPGGTGELGFANGGFGLVNSDLVIIGGGAAGLGAARAARRRGASVTLISEGPLGGDCTFSGCVPSKTLLRAAREGRGFDDAMATVAKVVASIAANENDEVLRAEGVDVVRGHARFISPTVLDVDGARLAATRVVLATGAGPLVPPIAGLDRRAVLTNEELFSLRSRPDRLAILGGGPIGVEMAEAFAHLGSQVTLIEAAPRLLPREEPEASVVLEDYLVTLGVRVLIATSCVEVHHADSHTRLVLDSGEIVECDALVVAVGRRPSSGDLGLETAHVRVDPRGFVIVDERLRTSRAGFFGAGDVAQALQFTHVADETGRIAAGNALGRVGQRRFHPEWIPMVTFTGLEVARVGVTEAAAPARARVAYLPMNECDRATMSGEERGFVKLIVGPRRLSGNMAGGSILGATIVAPRAGEMLAEVVLAMRAGMFSARLAVATHAYPTWSMAVQLTASQFFGEFGGRQARPAKAGGDT